MVIAHLEKLSQILALKMHKSEIMQLPCNIFDTSWCVSIASLRPKLENCNPIGPNIEENAFQLERSMGHAHRYKQVEPSYIATIQRLIDRKKPKLMK